MLTDTHCHLVSEKLRDQVADLVAAAHENNVTRILNIAYTWETTTLGLEIAQAHDSVWTTCGIQPHDAVTYDRELAERMEALIVQEPKILAVGEIGLDAHYTLSPMDQQLRCFEHFLDIACTTNKPVVVHVRQTHREVVELLKSRIPRGLRGVIHCFTGTQVEAHEFLDLGFYLSFSGIVTFKNATELANVAKDTPDDRILIETDAPYLAPIPFRGKLNQPAYVRSTAEFLATLRGVPLEELAALTSRNAENLFHFSG